MLRETANMHTTNSFCKRKLCAGIRRVALISEILWFPLLNQRAYVKRAAKI